MKVICVCIFLVFPKIQGLNFNENKIFGENQMLSVPRNLMPTFGFPSYGVHCNGWSTQKETPIFSTWQYDRKRLMGFQRLYDNLFAGGQPSNISIKIIWKKKP